MTQIRKVPFNAGAEWLLAGFGLWRKAPLALGLLGAIWGALSLGAAMTGQLWLTFLVALLGPILFGGIMFAAREVEQGRSAQPAHLAQGVRDGKTGRLLAMLLPQVAALIVLVVLLLVMFGPEQLQQMANVMQQMQDNPDPALMETLPTDRMFGWLLLAMVVGVAVGFFTFIAIPDVMFTDRGAFAAMGASFRACVRNLPAVLLLIVLTVIAVLAISVAVNIVTALLGWAIGRTAALFVGQLLMMAVLMPVMAGALYHAWRQMLGDAPVPPVVAPASGGFEA